MHDINEYAPRSGRLIKENGTVINIADQGMPVQVTGSNLEQFGATVANRPAANSVKVGTVFIAVQTQKAWQSDGANWVEVL